MNLVFCPLFSGSTGNACFVASRNTRLLVDAGLTAQALTRALGELDCAPDEINGIVITHEHIDHIKSVGVMARRYGIPVYANEATWIAMSLTGKLGDIPPRCRITYQRSMDFMLGDVHVAPVPISHDAADPSGYILSCGMSAVGVVTDTGMARPELLERYMGLDAVLLESNHDVEMLKDNPQYPAALKERILGKKGHLSNEAAGEAACVLARSGVKRIALGHLSQHNNTPELAFDTVGEALSNAGFNPGADMELAMTWPDRMGRIWSV